MGVDLVSIQDRRILGGIFREARERLNLSQEELGARIERPQEFVSRIENGSSKWPDVETFRAICEELGLDRRKVMSSVGYIPDGEEPLDVSDIPNVRVFAMMSARVDELAPEDRQAARQAIALARTLLERSRQHR